MRRFLSEESGQGMVEYTLIVTLIALAAFAAFKGLGETAGDLNNDVVAHMPNHS